MNQIDAKLLCDVFLLGVDYGQLLMEQERDSEDLFDAVGCMAYSRKYNVPSTPAPRRQPHGKEWRKAKSDSIIKFIDIFNGKRGG